MSLASRCWGKSLCRPVLTSINILNLKAKITLREVATALTIIWIILISCNNLNLLIIQLLVTTWAFRVGPIMNVLLAHNSLNLIVNLITKKGTWQGAKFRDKYHARIWETLTRSCNRTETYYKWFRNSSNCKTRSTTWTAQREVCTEYPPKHYLSTTTTKIEKMLLFNNSSRSNLTCIEQSTTKHSNMISQLALTMTITTTANPSTKFTMMSHKIRRYNMTNLRRSTSKSVKRL